MTRKEPVYYTIELAEAICDRLGESESLRSICKTPGMPDKRSVLRWLRDNPEFLAMYEQARIEQAENDADIVSEIRDQVIRKEIDPASARVAMDCAKWSAGKRNPKKYGDRIDLNHSGEIKNISDAQVDERIAMLREKMGL